MDTLEIGYHSIQIWIYHMGYPSGTGLSLQVGVIQAYKVKEYSCVADAFIQQQHEVFTASGGGCRADTQYVPQHIVLIP